MALNIYEIIHHFEFIFQANLEAQLNIHKQDSRHRQQHLQSELENIAKRQQQLERTNAELQQRAGDVRSVLRDLELTETDYMELRARSEEELSLRDYVAVSFSQVLSDLCDFKLKQYQVCIKGTFGDCQRPVFSHA